MGLPRNALPVTPKFIAHFDFWIGNWDVYTLDEQKAGVNSISREENSCLLIERWTSVQGGTGQSYNFYDPGLKKWRQLWVSRGAVIDYSGGVNAQVEMVLEGTIAPRLGEQSPFRGVWTPLADGSVRQYFQQYNRETKEWDDWFTGIYRRQDH